MYYLTLPKPQIDIGEYTLDMFYRDVPIFVAPDKTKYITVYNKQRDINIGTFRSKTNYNLLQHTLQTYRDVPKMYYQFKIPKKNGGYRTIHEPNPELKTAQTLIYQQLQQLGTHAHDCVYSYTAERTCKDAIIKHQQAHNSWFYKFDIENFFPNCTAETLTEVLHKKVYPFCAFSEQDWDNLLKIALYNNELPQGSPLSPILSNMVLLPLDYYMYYHVKHFNGVYTRYADDVLISFPEHHDLEFVQNMLTKHLKEQVSEQFKLNTSKSRCGSINGSNWNLGLMLNKDNNITIGHKRKLELKAKLNNFIYAFTNKKYWSIIETQVLQGELNYFKQIEPEYADFVVHRLESKYHTDLTVKQMFYKIITESI